MLSGISSNYDQRHINRIDKEILIKGGEKIEIEVDMITMNSIKDQIIDFVSIDTEGNEFEIVSSINFYDFHIKALVIENNYKQLKIENYLQNFGYILIFKLEMDDFYILKKEYTSLVKLRLLYWVLKSTVKK